MPQRRRFRPLLLAALGLLAALPYANALENGFAFDDLIQIVGNPAVMHGVDLPTILAMPLFPGDLYRPLTTLTFAVNESLTPGNTTVFHGVNIFLHVLVTLLVAWWAQRLSRRTDVALLTAVIFAVHPIHTEAVTSLVGRAELLSALGLFTSMLAMTRSDTAPTAGRRRAWMTVALVAFSGALLSKESTTAALPLLFLLRIAERNEPWGAGIRRELGSLDWVPFLLCVAAFLGLRGYVIEGQTLGMPISPLNNILTIVPATMRVRSALGIVADNLSLFQMPLVLSADYSHAQVPVLTEWFNARTIVGGGFLFACLVAGVACPRRLGLAFLFPLVTMALTSNILFPIGTIRGERLLYVPSAGLCLLTAWGMGALRHTRAGKAAQLLALAWIVGLAGRTWARNPDWRDNRSLHASAVQATPFSAKAHYNHAVQLAREGSLPGALEHFRRSLDLYPWEGNVAQGLGNVYDKLGLKDRAEAWYLHTTRLDPTFLSGHVNLCRVRLERGDLPGAEEACRAGLRRVPDHAELLKGMGMILIGKGQPDAARPFLEAALQRNPADTALRRFLEPSRPAP